MTRRIPIDIVPYCVVNKENIKPFVSNSKLLAKNILNTTEDMKVIIIANDMDYLQLAGPRVKLINLKYKYLTDNKKWSGNPEEDLFCKIVMGDKSDNIPSIFKKCGPKTALKYYNDKDAFEKQ